MINQDIDYDLPDVPGTSIETPSTEATSMAFSPNQEQALARIENWYRTAKNDSRRQVFRLFGYAGTGKTTLAKETTRFARKVQFGALTGKAALVLRGKGCDGARTIHSMIYRSMDKSQEELKRMRETLKAIQADPARREEAAKLTQEIEQLRRTLAQPSFTLNPHAFDRTWDEEMECYVHLTPPDLLVIDECSMVDQRVGEDLLSFRIPVLVLGDPAQLPPVSGGGFFTNHDPDVLLTEIHRQAADNPVVDIATRIRTVGMPPLGQYGESRIVERTALKQDEWLAADQILAGMNRTRRGINNRVRTLRGYQGLLPNIGERLVCLRNNHQKGLLNGSMWEPLQVEDAPGTDYFSMTLRSLDDPERELVTATAHKKPFLGQEYEDNDDKRSADEFDFGYCITTHKSQGSEWEDVIYIDEWSRADKKLHQYTGVTRASRRITVVKW